MVRTLSAFVVVTVASLAIAACGSSSKSSSSKSTSAPATTSPTTTAPSTTSPAKTPATAAVKISSGTIRGLGSALVNAQGRTLYIFEPDHDMKVTCVGTCAAVWPPVLLPNGAKPVAAGSVKQSLLGSDPDPAGGRVVTYAGWPLYTYVADTAPGQAQGQALNLNGGLWYVISPKGTLITKKP